MVQFGEKKKTSLEEAVFDFQESGIDITFNGMTMAVSGEGKGFGRARIKGINIQALARLPFKEKTVSVWVEDSWLWVESLSVQCQWTDINPPLIELPMDSPLLDILAVGKNCDEEQILASGLAEKIKEAEETKNNLVSKAISNLKPLEITEKDFEELINSKITKRSRDLHT